MGPHSSNELVTGTIFGAVILRLHEINKMLRVNILSTLSDKPLEVLGLLEPQ